MCRFADANNCSVLRTREGGIRVCRSNGHQSEVEMEYGDIIGQCGNFLQHQKMEKRQGYARVMLLRLVLGKGQAQPLDRESEMRRGFTLCRVKGVLR